MESILNTIRREASQQVARLATARYAKITSYDPQTFSVQVEVQPDGDISGWIPLGTLYVGDGWGLVAAPSLGDVVLVEFAEGDYQSGVLIARLFYDGARPPVVPSGEFWLVHKSTSALQFKNDGSVELVTNSHLIATVGGDVRATVSGGANITVSGDLDAMVGGDVSVDAGGDASVSAGLQIEMQAPQITLTGLVDVIGNLSVAGNITFTSGHNLIGNGDITTTGNVSDGTGSIAAMRTTYNSHTHNDPQGGTVAPPNQPM